SRRAGWCTRSATGAQIEHVDRALATADAGEPVCDSGRRDFRGGARGIDQRHSPRELCRQRRGMCAAATVGGARLDATYRDRRVPATIEEMIDRLAVTTGDQHGACTARD